VAMEVPRSEVQAPVLSARIWPAVRTRIRNALSLGPGTTEWFTDSYWDSIAQKAKDDFSCGQVGPVLVNAAPVWHQAWKTLTVKGAGKCPQWMGSELNRREVSPDEHEEVKAALQSIGCQLTAKPLSFEHIFAEQAHQGERLCEPWRGRCRKWVDGGAKDPLPGTCFRHVPEVVRTEFAEFAKRGMVTYNDTEHLLGGLQVGIYEGLP